MNYPTKLGLKTKYPSTNVLNGANEETLIKREREESSVEFFLNKTELNTVKTLFQIRNAQYYKKYIKPVQLSDYSTDIFPKERVFIAGKIFPVINILFNYTDVRSVEEIINPVIEILEGASKNKYYDNTIHNSKYISIGRGKIRILLPKNYGNINFPQLMYDFLTNKSYINEYIGGEFPDYDTYKLALRNRAIKLDDWTGQDGSWLTKDRDSNGDRWRRGYSYIIKNKIKGRLAPFKQIYTFYDDVDWYITNVYKHEVKWCKGAKALVKALGILEGGFFAIANDVETILNELNLGICDYAIEKFHELMYGKYAKTPLKGDDAYKWDVAFITHEQGVVAPPIYRKTSKKTLQRFQDMSDKDGMYIDEINAHGMGALLISIVDDIIPAFDDFNPPAKVTDDLFRIDLPLLMLYLDRHQINKNRVSPSLKNYLTSDGHVNDECKKIIKKYVR